MSSNAIGVVGSDGTPPIYQPDARWTVWSIQDIYRGVTGLNKYIPKVNDWVMEPETGETYRVVNLDPVTFIPELGVINIQTSKTTDELVSSTNDNYRVYFDQSVTPFTLKVDGFMRIYSATATYARIYRGHFIDPDKLVSRRYDNNGNFLGNDIPLQIVAYNNHDNYAIKSIPGCTTNETFVTGEACTVVAFDVDNKVISKVTCIVEETTFVTQTYAEQKYITNIFLKSAFIDSSDATLVNYPVNLPLSSFNPIGVVQYNDGSQIEYPVDGDKFKLYGLDMFVSTIVGQRVPLVLSYRIGDDETAVAHLTSDSRYVTRPYSLMVSNPNRSYSVKLFVYPVWQDTLNGYKYKVFMMNLDRNMLYDVTTYTGIASTSPSFNPLAYGITQRITFTVDLANVSGIYNNFLHVQTVDIVLRGQASDSSLSNIWEVSSQVPNNNLVYGRNLRAIRDNVVNTKIQIHNNLSTVESFVDTLYKPTMALYNPITELEAPVPTHIEVQYGNESQIVPISDYTQTFVFSTSVPMYTNIDVVFLKESVAGMLKLSVASLTVR